MNNITLATLFAEKFIAEVVPENDPRKYADYQFFIDAILKLIEDHPFIRNLIEDKDLNLSNILATITEYFEGVQLNRGFSKKELVIIRRFIRTNNRFRNYETSNLLLTTGFPMLYVFFRMWNSNEAINNGAITIGTAIEELIKEYPDPDNPNPEQYVLIGAQQKSPQIKNLYNLIQNPSTPAAIVCNEISSIERSINVSKSI